MDKLKKGRYMKITKYVIAVLASLPMAATSLAAEAPLVSIKTQDDFFNSISKHCGKSYEGRVTVDNAAGGVSLIKN